MYYAIEIVPFGDFSDPRLVARLAYSAEKAGWEGLYHEFGEPAETSRRGAMLDEGLRVLDQLLLWTRRGGSPQTICKCRSHRVAGNHVRIARLNRRDGQTCGGRPTSMSFYTARAFCG